MPENFPPPTETQSARPANLPSSSWVMTLPSVLRLSRAGLRRRMLPSFSESIPQGGRDRRSANSISLS